MSNEEMLRIIESLNSNLDVTVTNNVVCHSCESNLTEALGEFAALVQRATAEDCAKIVRAYEVQVGFSAAGEMAQDWTIEAKDEIEETIRTKYQLK